MPQPTVKQRLAEGQTTLGTWLSLGSVVAARFLARAGFHWLTVDLEHSHTDWSTAAALFGAIADAGCTPLARVPANSHENIKRALDCGAHGIVVPMVKSPEEALAAISAAKYPPDGNRSVGGSLHALNFGLSPNEYYAKANSEILVILQCEHVAAVDNFDGIFGLPGIDAVFVGPNDLAASMKSPMGDVPSAAYLSEIFDRILEGCRRNEVAAGIHCFSAEEARRRAEQGWQFLAINSELKFMMEGAMHALKPFAEQVYTPKSTAAPGAY